MSISIYFEGLALIAVMMTLLWLLSLWLRDASIVDIFWGPGFAITGVFYALRTGEQSVEGTIATVLVCVWGLRLGYHLARRNIGKDEDFRYQRWREEHGDSWWWRSLLQVFYLQGVIMWLVSMPLLGAQYGGDTLNAVTIIAAIVWTIGFVFEAVGDYQLAKFKRERTADDAVLDTGLWRYTRHPNYFGDAVQWWGFYLLALAAGAWFTIISPILMTYLLMRVSGVAMLEKSLKESKPKYADYIRRTSAFFPMPPANRD